MKINPLLTDFLQDVSKGSPRLAKQIEKTACRYAKPSGCCDTIVHVMNRVKNILLSLIGCSDWQRTVRAVRKDLQSSSESEIKKLHEAKKFVKTLELPPEKEESAIKILNNQMNSCIQLIKPFSKYLVDLSVKIQNGKFEDKTAIDGNLKPTFDALRNNGYALQQKAQKEFQDKDILDVYYLIKEEMKL